MADTCDTCGHEKAMGRCWRLTCPTNGAPYGLLDLVADDLRVGGVAAVRVDGLKIERIDPMDLYIPPEAKSLDDLGPQPELMSREQMAERFGIGEKVQHVLKAPNNQRQHHCHWPGCGAQVKPAVWGCRKHWYMLPDHLRRLIWQTYRPGQEQSKTPSRAYVEAAQAVQKWIAENHPPERKLL